VSVRAILLPAVALILAGCLRGSNVSDAQSSASAGAALAPAAKGTCPLTLPNGNVPPGEADVGANHGNGKLWTAMWPHNVVIATPDYIEPNGAVGMKWGWWRGVEGKLRITGRRLDGEAPRLTAYVPDGYGKSGFQASGISFPTVGCWEVTGSVGDVKLRFVTLVLKAARYWPPAEDG
jgi:hypothetical protein